MPQVDRAVSLFSNDCNCAQAVLGAYADRLGLDPDTACRVACPFGGGMRTADTCGAVSGALMVLGLMYGPSRCDDKEARNQACEKAAELQRQFRHRLGTTVCRDLLGCDISTEDGLRQARERELFKRTCPEFVKSATEILEQLLPKRGFAR